ncbi:MAG: SRPBCC domain-containing protein [Pseudomonadota bacterium]
MKQYQAAATINASPAAVWSILTDASAYPSFDPYCDKIEGEIARGQKIKAFSKLSPGRAFPVKVTEFEPGKRMVWAGGMPLGLFKGERTFSLNPGENGTVHFDMREVFSGPMLALIGKSLPDMTEPFQKFAEGLKAKAEAS